MESRREGPGHIRLTPPPHRDVDAEHCWTRRDSSCQLTSLSLLSTGASIPRQRCDRYHGPQYIPASTGRPDLSQAQGGIDPIPAKITLPAGPPCNAQRSNPADASETPSLSVPQLRSIPQPRSCSAALRHSERTREPSVRHDTPRCFEGCTAYTDPDWCVVVLSCSDPRAPTPGPLRTFNLALYAAVRCAQLPACPHFAFISLDRQRTRSCIPLRRQGPT